MLHPLSEERVGGWDGRARFSELREVSQSPYGVQQSVGPAVGRGILLLINASSVESPLATIFSLPRPTCVAVFGIDGGGVSTVGTKRGSSACLPRNHPLITHCAPSLTPSPLAWTWTPQADLGILLLLLLPGMREGAGGGSCERSRGACAANVAAHRVTRHS